jgi:FlaA1/EpsC-like NDP-sugar epimerase
MPLVALNLLAKGMGRSSSIIVQPAGVSTSTLPGQAGQSFVSRAFLSRIASAVASRRFPLVLFTHLVLVVASSFLAILLRFDGLIPPALLEAYFRTLPWMLMLRLVTFLPFGLYGGLWRYTGVWDLTRIVLSVLTSSAVIYVLVHAELGPSIVPRSIIIIDSVLLISFLGGVRLLWRIVPDALRSKPGRRILVLGAGDAGEMVVREMRKSAGYQPVGFVDHDPTKVGRTIHGVTVLGTPSDLPRIVTEAQPSEVLVAIPSADVATVRAFVRLLEPFKLRITTLPSPRELVNGRVGIGQIRPLTIEDLLPRSPVALCADQARALIHAKRVLVTGAGGSIGSELCRQIVSLHPASLILFERYENSLYAIANELIDRQSGGCIHPVIGDVTDKSRVDTVFSEYRPDIVFHAAAHKHVPLMEGNPCEAVKNNVAGTQTVAEAAQRHGVERFVLISTDKAVNPSSVMGASKRVAELIVQSIGARTTHTRFVVVRFGNVLGSNGSVIPRMVEQIRAGGPVTVTHPEIRRYFMLIPEAVQLVLQAAVLAQDQETFVLDMGEQIRVLDVARNLIRLSGFVPDEEIPITFVGLRPGEKLTEELVGESETLAPAGVEKISRVVRAAPVDRAILADRVRLLVSAARQGRTHVVLGLLREIVPTFGPSAADVPADVPAVVRQAPTASVKPVSPPVVAIATSAQHV